MYSLALGLNSFCKIFTWALPPYFVTCIFIIMFTYNNIIMFTCNI
nr:MAG TPA: hypothetical protein [Caudoviricetes sp.]